MDFKLHLWRQKDKSTKGSFETHAISNISPNMSFLEMLNELNRELVSKGIEPFAFDYDCMEGICGTCCLMINGVAHGPDKGVTTCQTHMRVFKDGEEIFIEPWRASAFPILKDLVTDRSSFERILQSGGYISASTGNAPDANAIPISKIEADTSMDAAQCIGCGACVASCKNGSAMLFVAAKVAHLNHLPQGQIEADQRVLKMVEAMDNEGFGNCTNQGECEAVCPKEISIKFIAELNRSFIKANIK